MTNNPLNAGLAIAATAAVLWSMPAAAQTVVFSNLGPGNTYGGLPAWIVNNDQQIAAPFTPSSNFTLTQIDAAMFQDLVTPPEVPSSVTLSLEGASANGLPNGALLESFTLDDLPFCCAPGTIQPSQIAKPTSPVDLRAGTEYWLVARPTSSSKEFDWSPNITGDTGFASTCCPSGSWRHDPRTSPAFAVFGAPEPATLGLMVLGLLGAGFAGRKRQS